VILQQAATVRAPQIVPADITDAGAFRGRLEAAIEMTEDPN
jgi:hypothetical protein